jgi:Holliday junction resolvase
MSYESRMLEKLRMPTRNDVERVLLRVLLQHGGVVREFGSGEGVVQEIADLFRLTEDQRSASLETVYRKENRVKKSSGKREQRIQAWRNGVYALREFSLSQAA